MSDEPFLAKELLQSTYEYLTLNKFNKRNHILRDVLRTNMPYWFCELKNGRMMPVNRYYKPLGIYTNDWITYENYDVLSFSKDSVDLTHLCKDNYFAHDYSTLPWVDKKSYLEYLNRVKNVFGLKDGTTYLYLER